MVQQIWIVRNQDEHTGQRAQMLLFEQFLEKDLYFRDILHLVARTSMGRKRVIIPSDSSSKGLARDVVKISEALRSEIKTLLDSKQIACSLGDKAWDKLEKILQQYDFLKASSHRIPNRETVANKKKKIAARAQSLAAALMIGNDPEGRPYPQDIQALWEIENALRDRWPFDIRLRGECGHYEWDIEGIAFLLDHLAQAAKSKSRFTEEVSPKDFGFHKLCRGLALCWKRATKTKATARKDDDKRKTDHSPFVLFVQTALKALPEDTRPHFNSTSALATALSKELRDK